MNLCKSNNCLNWTNSSVPKGQGSPNQAKWATFLPWFQWNCPISVKKRSFSRPDSLFKSIFFSPIIILFLQYWRKRCSHVPEDPYTHTGFDVQYFIPNSLIASFLTSMCSTFVLWKVGGHAVVGKEMLKFWLIFGSLPDFPSLHP